MPNIEAIVREINRDLVYVAGSTFRVSADRTSESRVGAAVVAAE